MNNSGYNKLMLLSAAVVLALSLWGWSRVRFVSSLDVLLPEGSEARATIGLLREADFADKVVLRLVAERDEVTEDQLVESLNRVAAKVDPRTIARVVRPPAADEVVEDLFFFLEHAGELLGPDDLADLATHLGPDAIHQRLRQCYLEVLKPGGDLFAKRMIRQDPLGIGARILQRSYRLSQAMGFRAEIRQGHFFHTAGREAILLLETSVPMTDVAGSRELVAGLERLRTEVGPGIRLEILCGHLHTFHNDRTLRRDIRLAVMIATAAFLALFLALFRDLRAGIIFVIPCVAIAVAIGLCGWWYAELSTMVAGLAGAMAGIAMDYGIHVYVPVRHEPDPRAAVRHIAKPVILGALTTMGVFVAFMFSGVPAYRQLGWMASLSLLISLLAALLILPVMVRPAAPEARPVVPWFTLRRWGGKTRGLAIFACLLLPVAIYLAAQVRFDANLMALDGTPAEVLAVEQDFLATWGRGEAALAIAVTAGKTREEAAVAADRLYHAAKKSLPEGEPWSLSVLWPAAATRQAQAQAWQGFWTPPRIMDLQAELARQGTEFGFATEAFAPFFATLAKPDTASSVAGTGGLVASLEQRFVQQRQDGWWFFTYFPDTPENVRVMRGLVAQAPGGGVVSRNAIGQALAEASTQDSRRICLISIVFIVLATLLLTRPLRYAWIVILPAMFAEVVVLLVMVYSPLSLNVASAIAVIVVIGLCIDYGVLVVHAWVRDEGLGVWRGTASVTLSAVTTLIGAMSLFPAQHPALRHVGLTLFIGVGVGYLVAMFVVPGLCLLLDRRQGLEPESRPIQP